MHALLYQWSGELSLKDIRKSIITEEQVDIFKQWLLKYPTTLMISFMISIAVLLAVGTDLCFVHQLAGGFTM